MCQIIDGKEVAEKIRKDLKREVEKLNKENCFPKLAVILVGQDPASKIYVNLKSKACDEVGIKYEEYLLDENTQMEELLDLIWKLNKNPEIHGILLQSPIPRHLDANLAFKTIYEEKDVDGFNPKNIGRLSMGHDCLIPCTPYGVVKMLEYYNIDAEGKNVVILGRSNIVGKPMLQCMLNKNATVTVCHSKTNNLEQYTTQADILISAIGKPNFVTKDMVKQGAVVIDVGINRLESGKVVGDVDFEEVSKKASYITPVPGGVGPMTITMLMHNVIKASKLCEDIVY